MPGKWLLPIVFVFVFILPLSGAASALSVDGDEAGLIGTAPRLLLAAGENRSKYEECTLGNAVADAMRIYLDSDVAILCGGDLIGNLYPGEITRSDLSAIFSEDRALATAEVTINGLRGILETGLSHIVVDEAEKIDGRLSAYDGFPQISGFILLYDASAPAGERVLEIRINGKTADPADGTATLTLAATQFMLDGGYGLPAIDHTVPSAMTLTSVTARLIRDGMEGYARTERRIRPLGIKEGDLVSLFPLGFIFIPILIFVLLEIGIRKKDLP